MIHSKKGKLTFLDVSQATWRLCSHRKELLKTSIQKIISFNRVMLWKHKCKIFHHSPLLILIVVTVNPSVRLWKSPLSLASDLLHVFL